MKLFKQWMKRSNGAEKKHLARLSSINYLYLYQIKDGSREVSSELAAKIEQASIKINKKNRRLPVIGRGDLSKTCNKCPYIKLCNK
jgi:ribosome biogenesis protein Nip4